MNIKEASYLLVKNTNNFEPINKSDLINIYYTIINSGWNEFTFIVQINILIV